MSKRTEQTATVTRIEFTRADDADKCFRDLDAEGYSLRLFIDVKTGKHVIECIDDRINKGTN